MISISSRTTVFGLLCAVSLALGGCGSMLGNEYANDPSYSTGYTDGCGSGTSYVPGDASTLRRDSDLWASQKAYRAGWKSGFNACKVGAPSTMGTAPDAGFGRRNGPSGF